MKIGFEARWITFERTGFGNYARNLIHEMVSSDNSHEYLVYVNKDIDCPDIFNRLNVKKIIINQFPELYKHVGLPLDIARRGAPDIFHFLYNAPSLFFPWPVVLTIHDMSYNHVPAMISLKNYLSINLQLKLTAKRCRRIITVSENSKKDIVRYLGIPSERIDVIYEGIDPKFHRIEDTIRREAVRRRYMLPDRFILYVGTYLPHKNLNVLLHAFHRLKCNHGISQDIVLAGKQGRNFNVILDRIHRLGLEQSVKCIGYVDDEDLACLYSLSDVFVYPSLYEGFGLPLLEAMACGAPVVSSNSSCLPEIGGVACRYFNPNEADTCAKALFEVLHDSNEQTALVQKGYNNLQRFSWRRAALKTLECYKNAV
jgi:glycosyltransferase involved in cell wall biosynthesis